jgi:hypothetical protein
VKRALILGGYGGFGARLSRRLAEDGWEVLIAGRDRVKAEALALRLPDARGILVDRNGDLGPVLRAEQPDLLIDAAGPFQTSDYRVAEACIAAGVHYFDLADARGFVCGIGALDMAARKAGVAVISGASSIPALSGAVVAELAADMHEVRAIEHSISASTRGTTGNSVGWAVLSYAGKTIEVWRGGRKERVWGWQGLRRMRYAVAGERRLNRLVALADVPDLQLMPERFPGKPTVLFRAGPEFAFHLLGLWLLSWPVRWGWLKSLDSWSRWLLPAQRLTRGLGSKRSAMAVEVKGKTPQGLMRRSWSLVASDDHGPEVPTLAAQLLGRKLREGALPPGARDAGALLDLEHFRSLFGPLAIRDELSATPYLPLYRRVMGEPFERLPDAVRNLHDLIGDAGAAGEATVTRGAGLLARMIGDAMGFPPAGEHAVHVSFTERDGIERWTRDFSGQCFTSELSQKGTRLVERFGSLRFHFELVARADGLNMVLAHWTVLGLPLPLALAPCELATERADGEDFCFDVAAALPLIGEIVHYRGRLRLLNAVAPPRPKKRKSAGPARRTSGGSG